MPSARFAENCLSTVTHSETEANRSYICAGDFAAHAAITNTSDNELILRTIARNIVPAPWDQAAQYLSADSTPGHVDTCGSHDRRGLYAFAWAVHHSGCQLGYAWQHPDEAA